MFLRKSYCVFFIMIFFLFHGQGQVLHGKFKYYKNDTLFMKHSIILSSTLVIENEEIVLIHEFRQDTLLNDEYKFDEDKLLPVTILHDNIQFDNIIYYTNSFHPLLLFGNEIDNPSGEQYILSKNEKQRIYAFEGYYPQCNGSACNGGAVMIISFTETQQNVYTLYINKDLYSIDRMSIKPQEEDTFLVIFFNCYTSENITFKMDKQIELLSPKEIDKEIGIY